MISSILTFPQNGDTVAAEQDFTITVQTQNLQAGAFTNADATYYAAPQQLNGQGQVIGHTHITVQDLGNSLNPTTPPDPTQFAFFKGINDAGNGKGLLSADVAGGLPAGNFRVCTLTSASNHQPVIVSKSLLRKVTRPPKTVADMLRCRCQLHSVVLRTTAPSSLSRLAETEAMPTRAMLLLLAMGPQRVLPPVRKGTQQPHRPLRRPRPPRQPKPAKEARQRRRDKGTQPPPLPVQQTPRLVRPTRRLVRQTQRLVRQTPMEVLLLRRQPRAARS